VTGVKSDPCAFRLREPCGRAWRDELVFFNAHWKPGLVRGRRFSVRSRFWTKPAQLTDVVSHRDGSLASARVWCRVDLEPEQELVLRLESCAARDSYSELFWSRAGRGWYEAGNRILKARIPARGASRSGDVPGPVAAVAVKGGPFILRGSARGRGPLSCKVILREKGPLFIVWTYLLVRRGLVIAEVESTIYAGEDFIRMRDSSLDFADADFVLTSADGFLPDRVLTLGGGERWRQNTAVVGRHLSAKAVHVDFHSGHQQMSNSWCGAYRQGGREFVGMIELNGCEWTRLSTNRLLMEVGRDGLMISAPLRGGRKEWALVASTTRRHVKDDDCREPNAMCRIKTRYSDIPLQKAIGWALDWEDRERRPVLHAGRNLFARVRHLMRANPALRDVYRRWAESACGSGADGHEQAPRHASALTALWLALGDRRLAVEAAAALQAEIGATMDAFWNEGAYMRLIIFDGRKMKLWMQAYDVLKSAGFIPAAADRQIRRDLAFLAYCFEDPEFFPCERALMDADDPDSWHRGLGRRIGDSICPPNFLTEYYTSFGMAGCLFRSHPRAEVWRRTAARLFERQLEKHYWDSGAYCESPNYHSHSFTMLNQLALALRRAGERDFYRHPRFRAQFDWFCRMQTPPIMLNDAARKFFVPWRFMRPRRKRYAMLPGNGNTGSNASDMPLPVELAFGGAVYQRTDPVMSRRCMTTWRRAGCPVSSHYCDIAFLAVADPSLPGSARVGLESCLLEGNYAVMRAMPETSREIFILVKCGQATHHNDFDEGGFAMWANGCPLAGDFGYFAEHEGKRCGASDTWKHNCVEFNGMTSGFLGIEKTLPPERWISTDLADYLVCHIPITNFRDLEAGSYMDMIKADRIEYRRLFIFVKPRFLLVLDRMNQCPYPRRWWLHAQARSVTVRQGRALFRGAFGTDLAVFFVEPPGQALEMGAWSVMKHVFARGAGPGRWRVVVAPLAPGERMKVCSRGNAVAVDSGSRVDLVLLDAEPFHAENSLVRFRGKAGAVSLDRNSGRLSAALLDGDELVLKREWPIRCSMNGMLDLAMRSLR